MKIRDAIALYNKRKEKKHRVVPQLPWKYCFNISRLKEDGNLWEVKKLGSGVTRWTKVNDSTPKRKDEKKLLFCE